MKYLKDEGKVCNYCYKDYRDEQKKLLGKYLTYYPLV